MSDEIELEALLDDRDLLPFPSKVVIDDESVDVDCDEACEALRERASRNRFVCWYEPGVGYVCKAQ